MHDLGKEHIGNTANGEFIPKVHFLSKKTKIFPMKYYTRCPFLLKNQTSK